MNRKNSILILEDETSLGEVMCRVLELDGYHVQVSENGEHAVDSYRRALENGCPFDTVIMDLCIPNGIGSEDTLCALTKLNPRIKIIITTGDASNPALERFAGRGHSDVLPKPFVFSDLKRIVRQSIEGRA